MAIFAVTTEMGPYWDHSRQIREQQAWAQHAEFADELVADRHGDRASCHLDPPVVRRSETDGLARGRARRAVRAP